jgi:hypothetical protein
MPTTTTAEIISTDETLATKTSGTKITHIDFSNDDPREGTSARKQKTQTPNMY